MILIRLRQGIGFDIEYNDDICHRIDNPETGKEEVIAYAGILISLPFLKIYIGDFFE